MFSQMQQVCSTLFWFSHRILIHAGSMPFYLSQSLVLLTPLSWEIQMQSRTAHTCLVLNSSCHGGQLKGRWLQMSPYFLGKSLQSWYILPLRYRLTLPLCPPVSFDSSLSQQSFSRELAAASAGPSKLSEFKVIRCSRTGCFYFCFFPGMAKQMCLRFGFMRVEAKQPVPQ